MSQILYVDSFNQDFSMAFTYIQESISYNLAILNTFNDTSSPIFSAGKYVVYLYVTEDVWTQARNLVFMDIRRNPDLIQDLKTAPQFSISQEQLTSFLEDYNSTYDSNKDTVKLVLGSHPIRPRGSPSLN